MRAAFALLLSIWLVSSPSTCDRSWMFSLDDVVLLTQQKCPSRCERQLIIPSNTPCPTSVGVPPVVVCEDSDPSNVSAEVPTELNSSDVTETAVLPVEAPPETALPIAPFDEWTKEKLLKQDQHKIANGLQYHHTIPQTVTSDHVDGSGASAGESNGGATPPPSPQPVAVLIDAQRNYASKECGAKVLLGNPEAENRAAILNEKERDEYMRNPCDQARSKFFVVELCETIHATKIELANFELFSSGPKEVRVSGSERYPTTEWTPIGDFVAQDARNIQSFLVQTSRIYAKFLKFELLSHYGNEHYCTLSLVRVFGISMVDEYEIEAKFGEQGAQTLIIPHSTGTVEPVDDNKTNEAPPPEAKQNIVGAVKDVVVNITKGVIDKASALLRSASHFDKAQQGFTGRLFAVRRAECRSCPVGQQPSKCTNFCYMFNPMKRRSDPQPTPVDQPAPTSSHSVSSASSVSTTPSETPVASQSRAPTQAGETTGKVKRRRRRDSRDAFLALLRRYMNEARSVQSTKTAPVVRTIAAVPVVAPPTQPPTHIPPPVAPVLTTPVSMPGGSTNHKESVFIKLNNRIRALELNISLSSQYLSELSRRYVSQMDEIRRQYERTSKTANDTNRAADDAKRELSARIEKLQAALEEMDAKIANSIQTAPIDDDDEDIDADEMDGTEVAPLLPAHMLDEKRWTTEEVLVFVVISQLLTTMFVLLVSRCCRRRNVGIDAATVRQLVDEQLLARSAQLSPPVEPRSATPPVVDRFVFGDAVNGSTVVKAKKKRKKIKKMSIETRGTGDTWDSAMESTSSARSTGTPTPSELSSEIELPSPGPVFVPVDRDATPRGDLCLPPTTDPDPWIVPPCRKNSTSSLPSFRKKRHHDLLGNRNMFRVLQSPLKRKHQI